jgi:hypothetical protein
MQILGFKMIDLNNLEEEVNKYYNVYFYKDISAFKFKTLKTRINCIIKFNLDDHDENTIVNNILLTILNFEKDLPDDIIFLMNRIRNHHYNTDTIDLSTYNLYKSLIFNKSIIDYKSYLNKSEINMFHKLLEAVENRFSSKEQYVFKLNSISKLIIKTNLYSLIEIPGIYRCNTISPNLNRYYSILKMTDLYDDTVNYLTDLIIKEI